MKKKNKNSWLIVYFVAAGLCYLSYYFTRNMIWFALGLLFVVCGGLDSIKVKNEEEMQKGGYNKRNLEKAKKYDTKKS